MDKPKINPMKKSILFVITAFLFINSTFAQCPVLNARTIYNANIYSEPNKKTSVKLDNNTPIKIISTNGEYFVIKYNNKIAYIKSQSVSCNNKELKEFEKQIALLNHQGKLSDCLNSESLQPDIKPGIVTDVTRIDDPIKYEIDHIRYCAYKYNREMLTGYGCSIGAIGVFILGAATDYTEATSIVGAGLALTGFILIVDSQKWMKRIYVGPNGAGIKYTF
jgi:hypothetical protein